VAFEFSGGIAAGAFIGWWIDARYGTAPYALMTMTLLAVVGGFIRLIHVVRRFERSDRAREP
jgi:F0F1-type ATP synthase assembly protein I